MADRGLTSAQGSALLAEHGPDALPMQRRAGMAMAGRRNDSLLRPVVLGCGRFGVRRGGVIRQIPAEEPAICASF